MRTLNLARILLPALIGVTLLTLAAAARSDADAGGLARLRQAIATVDARAASSGAPSAESGETAPSGEQRAASPSEASGTEASGTEASGTEASGTPVSPPQPAAPADEEHIVNAPSASSAPAPAPVASTTSISEAVDQAIGQAASSSPGSGGGASGTIAAESNATTQLIWQVQISECTAHCADTEQYQAAEQQSTAHQVLAGAPPATSGIGAQAKEERSQATASVTQVQFGCVSHCSGATTTAAATPIAANLQQALEALLHQIATALLGLIPRPAVDQNAVEQVSYQSQSEVDGSLRQTQSVSQASTTTQEYDAASSALIGDLESALNGPQAASYEAVNETEQDIWQLQIGCLMFCEHTEQYQQAEQSNTTVQTVASAPGSPSSAPASLTDTATQLIWQAQIGCLMWCLDAEERQSASAENTLTVTEGGETAVTPPPESTVKSPPKGSEPAPGASAAGGSATATSPTGPAGPPSSGSGSATTAPPASPVTPALGGVALGGVGSPASVSKSRLTTRHSHISAAGASVGPIGGSETDVRTEPATLRAHLRRALASHRSAGPARASFGAVAAGATLGSRGAADLGTPAAVLLAAIALCGLCCLGIAALRARQGSRVRPADN